MITLRKIKIFQKYDGDSDLFARGHPQSEDTQISPGEWSMIDNLLHDIELINKRLSSPAFIRQTITTLKENCDEESFRYFSDKLEFYADFQKASSIIRRIREYTSPQTDVTRAGLESGEVFMKQLDEEIIELEFCNFSTLEKLKIDFLPTCTFQEISISNGWMDEYIDLAGDFDNLYERIMNPGRLNKETTRVPGFWSKLKALWS